MPLFEVEITRTQVHKTKRIVEADSPRDALALASVSTGDARTEPRWVQSSCKYERGTPRLIEGPEQLKLFDAQSIARGDR